jgi:hypothetical protein
VFTFYKALLMAGVTLAASAAVPDSTREWRFDVSLDGRPIGEHTFVLREGGDALELTSEARFRVRILFVDAYRYEHHAREWWRGDCLEKLDARTDANGKETVVAGARTRGEFLLKGDEPTTLDGCVQTFAYWNPHILEARRLLNPQTGEYVPVKALLMGRETIAGQPAERYRLIGEGPTPLQIDLWYSPTRDWLALESLTPEGRRLRYARKPGDAR